MHLETIESFYRAWGRMDVDEILSYFTADAVYHNVPLEPLSGTQAIRGWIADFLSPFRCAELRHLKGAESGDVAFSEHEDRFEFPDGRALVIRLAGVFEFRDGKIAAWRDYFDLETVSRQLPPAP